MTKVAIFEPEIGARGPVAWAYNLRLGLRALGHEADVVSFTKSGNSRKSWGIDDWVNHYGSRFWHSEPDVLAKWDDAPSILDTYDAVILTEPKQNLHDKEALKKGTIPPYVEVLGRLQKAKWTTAVHAPQYSPEQVPFLDHLFSQSSFSTRFLTHNPGACPTHPTLKAWDEAGRAVYHPLPLFPKFELDETIPVTAIIGMTGRFVPNKGPQLLALVAQRIVRDPWIVELWGSPSIGAGACPSFVVYENLVAEGSIDIHRPTRMAPLRDDPKGPKVEEVLDIIQPKRWGVRGTAEGPEIWFRGGYTDIPTVYKRIGVHVDLTASNYSSCVEYSQLEAMDAGSVMLGPSHMWDTRYRGNVMHMSGAVPGATSLRKGKAKEMQDELTKWLPIAMAQVGTDEHYESARHNRLMLRELNDAGRCGELLISLAMGG